MRSLLILSFFGISHAFQPANNAALKSAIDACVADDNTGATCYACLDGSHADSATAACSDYSTPTFVNNWDISLVTNLDSIFADKNFWTTDLTGWDTSSVTSMQYTFKGGFNADVSTWDTSKVATMYEIFKQNNKFDGDLPWDTSSVTEFYGAFTYSTYNKPLNWDVSSAKNMAYMFKHSHFNQDLNHWDFSSVTRLDHMFSYSKYNQPIDWNTQSCTKFQSVFYDSDFNQPIKLDLRSARTINSMFAESKFNQDIDWDVTMVTDFSNFLKNSDFNSANSKLKLQLGNPTRMYGMFWGSKYYGTEVQDWNVKTVTSMAYMFASTPFSHNLEMWDVTRVTDFSYMFKAASVNYNFNCWDMKAVQNMYGMFEGSGMRGKKENYAIKKAWSYLSNKGYSGSNHNSRSDPRWNRNGINYNHVDWNYAANYPDDGVKYCGLAGAECTLGNDCMSQSCVSSECEANTFGKECPATTCNAVTYCEDNVCQGRFMPTNKVDLLAAVDTCLDAVASGDCPMLNYKVPHGQGFGTYGAWNTWDTSSVTDFSNLFEDRDGFTQDISSWDTSNVKSMNSMFQRSDFSGDISGWDVSSVTNMAWMFAQSGRSNPLSVEINVDLSKWVPSSLTNGHGMFYKANFNGDISQWDTSELTYMKDMFFGSKFNRDISQWDVNKVCNFEAAFYNSDFDQNVNCWDFGECGTYGAKVQGMFGGTSKYSRVFCPAPLKRNDFWNIHLFGKDNNNQWRTTNDAGATFGSDGCTVTGCTLNGASCSSNANCLSGLCENNICNEYCLANEKASSNKCMACEAGKTNDAGDAATVDSQCDTVLCTANQKVVNNACEDCPKGSQRNAGDDASGADTSCTPILCQENEHVLDNTCTACVSGFRLAGDNALQGDTSCVADTVGENCATKDDCVGTELCQSGKCVKAPCLEDEHVQGGQCVPCATYKNPAGDDPNGADTECRLRGPCGGLTCVRGTCKNDVCDCPLGYSGMTCDRDVTANGRASFLRSKRKALPTKQDIIQTQRDIRTFVRDTLRKALLTKSTKQAIRETKMAVQHRDLKDRARVVAIQLEKQPVIAVSSVNKDTQDTCKQGVNSARCSMLDIKENPDEIIFLNTQEEAGSWSVLNSGDKILSKQTKVSEDVYDMQCWAHQVIFVDAGVESGDFYNFYTDKACSNKISKDADGSYHLNKNTKYTFGRCAGATSHPFEVYPTGTTPAAVGISGDETKSVQSGDLTWVCTSHPGMTGTFKAVGDTDWSEKVRFDTTSNSDMYECNDHIILIGSQAAVCTDDTCKNGGTCATDGYSFICTCPAGYTGNTCENQATITHCHQMDCSDYGGHKTGECTDCNIANCCNYATKSLFNNYCDGLTATKDYVKAKCCHRTYCL